MNNDMFASGEEFSAEQDDKARWLLDGIRLLSDVSPEDLVALEALLHHSDIVHRAIFKSVGAAIGMKRQMGIPFRIDPNFVRKFFVPNAGNLSGDEVITEIVRTWHGQESDNIVKTIFEFLTEEERKRILAHLHAEGLEVASPERFPWRQ